MKMKHLKNLIAFCILSIWQTGNASSPPICPDIAAIINTVNNLQVDNPYADGYKVRETQTFNTAQLWWFVADVDFSSADSKSIALQLVKDGINSIQLNEGPELNPNQSWWICFYTETTMAGTLKIYISTEIPESKY